MTYKFFYLTLLYYIIRNNIVNKNLTFCLHIRPKTLLSAENALKFKSCQIYMVFASNNLVFHRCSKFYGTFQHIFNTIFYFSANNLTKLQPKTFDGNDNLQIIKASQNPLMELMPYQFPPLKNLKTLDFSHCGLYSIDRKAFQNLGQSMETIWLNNNQLR